MGMFSWLKRKPHVFAISDLHFASQVNKPMDVFGGEWPGYEQKIEKDWKKKVRANDIVIVAGDLSWGMTFEEAKPDLDKIASFGGNIVICKGNHDYWWKSVSKVRENTKDNVYVLQNDAVKIGKYVFCGTRGWKQPEKGKPLQEEDAKILSREEERMKLALNAGKKLIEKGDKLVVVMHYPPVCAGLLDSAFTKMFEEAGVCAVVYGHLHGKLGRKVLQFERNGVKYYLTSCDQIENKLVKIY